jgi:hypothetical protein
VSDSEYLSVEIDDLTVGEIDEIEEIIDASIDSVGQPGARKGKFLTAIAFVVKRREDPAFTLEDARNVKIRLDEKAKVAGPLAETAERVVPNRAERRERSRKRG